MGFKVFAVEAPGDSPKTILRIPLLGFFSPSESAQPQRPFGVPNERVHAYGFLS
jgi:hypothetical protein